MPKKKKQPELKYKKLARVSRWNLCQQIASLLYQSELTEKELENGVLTCEFNRKRIY